MYHDSGREDKSVFEYAREYIDRSWNPVTLGFKSKKPSGGDGWLDIRINHTNVEQHFNGTPQNIGVQMGPASGGLKDVDLDCPEALKLGPAILPPTDAIFGRKSTPGSHRLYVSSDEIADHANITFKDPNRMGEEALLFELRIGGGGRGAQTVFPPSIHKGTGELICWEKYGEPARLDGSDLLRRCRLLAVCCLLVRYWPPTGGGCHDTALVVGGFLARAGLRAEEVMSVVSVIAGVSNADRAAELARTAGDAAENYYRGDRTYGLPQLAKTFGEKVADQIAEWLEYRRERATSGNAAPPPRESEDWPDPRDIKSGLEPVPSFDPNVLPEVLRPWLEDIADRMQAPLEYVVVPAMVMCGSLIGNKIALRMKELDDWDEVGNLWGMTVGRPGYLKTPAASEVFKPLRRAALKANEAYASASKTYEMSREIYEKKKKDAINKGYPPTDPAPVEPIRRVYVTNDTTYEKLCEILVDNPQGVLVHRDEFVSLLRYLDLEQNSTAKGFFNSAWRGMDNYATHRVIRGHTFVKSACVSLFGTTQPGVISDYVRHATLGRGDDGTIQRFGLVAWPDTELPYKYVDRRPLIDARNAAYAAVDRLDALTPKSVGAEQGDYDNFPFLRFAPEAQRVFVPWIEKLMGRIRDGGLSDAMASHLEKHKKLVASLALITHLLDAGEGPVSEIALVKAALWAEHLEAHAARLYSAGVQPARAAAKTLLTKIRAGHLRENPAFSVRDVQRAGWAGLGSQDDARAAIEMLCAHDWLWPHHYEVNGRTYTEYFINPKVRP
jgi:hypothetical protein